MVYISGPTVVHYHSRKKHLERSLSFRYCAIDTDSHSDNYMYICTCTHTHAKDYSDPLVKFFRIKKSAWMLSVAVYERIHDSKTLPLFILFPQPEGALQ